MKKILSWSLALLILVSSVITVSAVTVSDNASLLFPEGSVSVKGNTITLLRHIEALAEGVLDNEQYLDYNDPIIFDSGTHTIDLNGYLLSTQMADYAPGFIIKSGANVTIENGTEIGCGIYGGVMVEEGATLTVGDIDITGDFQNNGTVVLNNSNIAGFITSNGNITINNGYYGWGITIESGKAYINGGDFHGIAQFGGELYIKNCSTSSGTGGFYVSPDAVKTELSGGRYDPYPSDDPDYPDTDAVILSIAVPTGTTVKEDYITRFVTKGYKAIYSGFEAQAVGEEAGLTYYDLFYESVYITPLPENYSDIMKKITTEEVWTVYADAPQNMEDSEFLLSAVAKSRVANNKYQVFAYCNSEPFNPNRATIGFWNQQGYLIEEYVVDVEYKKPDAETQKLVNEKLEEMKDKETGKYKIYTLDDLYLINYLASNKFEAIDFDSAINFSKEFIKDVGGGKFTFGIDARLGDGDWFFTFAGGHTIVLYDGRVYGTTEGGVSLKYVIYVPSDTANNSDAYIKAALKRITDYLGKDTDVSIEVAGKLADLGDDINHVKEEIDLSGAGDSYYTLTIGENAYDFVIVKSDKAENFETPAYKGDDLFSKIKIQTTDKSVPLDTAITVKEVKNDTIKKALGTDTYVAYDITLYSNSLGANITKLNNGTFTVSIPIPDGFDADKLTAYYITDDGKTEEHEVTITDDCLFATFKTNHFSTYALTEVKSDGAMTPEADEMTSPNTGNTDNITMWLLLMMSLSLGSISIAIFKKAKQN